MRIYSMLFLLFFCHSAISQTIDGPNTAVVDEQFSLTLNVPNDVPGIFNMLELQKRSPSDGDFVVLDTLPLSTVGYPQTLSEDGLHQFKLRYKGEFFGVEIFSGFGPVFPVSVEKKEEIISIDETGIFGNGDSYSPSISADGRYIAFPTKATNLQMGVAPPSLTQSSKYYVVVRDRIQRTNRYVTLNNGNYLLADNNNNIAFSPDSTKIALSLFVGNLMEVEIATGLYNAAGGPTTQTTTVPIYSDDGNFIVYIATGNRVILHDLVSNSDTTVVDMPGNGGVALNVSGISSDGSYVVYTTTYSVSGLVGGSVDSNGKADVFLYNRITQSTTLISKSIGGVAEEGSTAAISADGRFVVFLSPSQNIAGPGTGNVFLYDAINAGQITRVSNIQAFQNIFEQNVRMNSAGTLITYVNNSNQSRAYNLLTASDNLITSVVNVITAGVKPSLSRDGRYYVSETTSNLSQNLQAHIARVPQ